MKLFLGALAVVALFAFGFYYVDNQPASNAQVNTAEANVSMLNDGRKLFRANCAGCHGEAGVGVEGAGPPFIHIVYEPNHHADLAFYSAALNGVRAHHWPYGDMPAQTQVSKQDVEKIVAYIRKLQRQKGIF